MNTTAREVLIPEAHFAGARRFSSLYRIQEHLDPYALLSCITRDFAKLPYENLSKIIKLGLDRPNIQMLRLPGEVMEGHEKNRLGGTCFSLSFLLHTVLSYYDFDSYIVMADMRSGRNIHCALVVTLPQGKFLVDPGYLVNKPVPLTNQGGRLYRSRSSGLELIVNQQYGLVEVYSFTGKERKWRYSFFDQPVSGDIFLDHWLHSFTLNSMNNICLTRVDEESMIYIHRTFMRETRGEEKKNYNIRRNLKTVVRQRFGIEKQFIEEALETLVLRRERFEKDGTVRGVTE